VVTNLYADVPARPVHYVRDYIDWDRLRQDLETWGEKSGGDESNSLQDVRVIDVYQACVVRLPHKSHYVALSYVWGKGSENQIQAWKSNRAFLEQVGSLNEVTLPCTILNAIKVCRNLDMRYLWADRPCIIQDADWATKSVQLDQMADTYSQARLTTVALEGEDVEYGLPGVSSARPLVQKQLAYSPQFGLAESTRDMNNASRIALGISAGGREHFFWSNEISLTSK
jgi:hypothetical protein